MYGSTDPNNHDDDASTNISYSNHLLSREIMEDDASQYQYNDYDCSICLERLEDPVWCGQGLCSMRSCRECLLTWYGKNTKHHCPHCQALLTCKSKIKRDDVLRKQMEHEQRRFPHVVQKVKEQSYAMNAQQIQIGKMDKKMKSLESVNESLEAERKVAMYTCLFFLVLWLYTTFSFWKINVNLC